MDGSCSVTVVIPTRNRPHIIRNALESVVRSALPPTEVLVVDQSTDDRTRLIVEEFACGDPRVRYCPTETVGSSAARNIGATLSRTEFVAYTDDDCVVDAGWLGSIIDEFGTPQIAAVYGSLLPYPEGPRTGIESALRAGQERVEYRGKVPPWYVGSGGNMAFRRAELLAAGGFDPLLGAGCKLRSCEDSDIAYRLLTRGRRIVFTPHALAYHRQWKDWRSQQEMERSYGVGAGAQFGKYIRCGDRYGVVLLLTWIWQLGVRRLAAGLLKWKNPKVLYLAYCQVVYPWIGLFQSGQHMVDRRTLTFLAEPLTAPYLAPSSAIAPSLDRADRIARTVSRDPTPTGHGTSGDS